MTYLILRILIIVSPFETSFSCRFSFFRSFMVPRFRCWYTHLACFLADGALRKNSCIMRTHSSINASLGKSCPVSQHRAGSERRWLTCASRNTNESRGRRGTSGWLAPLAERDPLRQRGSSRARTGNRTSEDNAEPDCQYGGNSPRTHLQPLKHNIYLLVAQRLHVARYFRQRGDQKSLD